MEILPNPPKVSWHHFKFKVCVQTANFSEEEKCCSFQSIRLLHWHSEMPHYAFHLLLGLYIPIVIMGSILNLMLLIVILSSSKLRLDPRNAFILTLAISDFFLCNFTSPLTLWSTLEGHWPFGSNTEVLCRLVKAGQNFPVIMSSFCIGAIACDRFRFITQPQKPQMTAKQVSMKAFYNSLADWQSGNRGWNTCKTFSVVTEFLYQQVPGFNQTIKLKIGLIQCIAANVVLNQLCVSYTTSKVKMQSIELIIDPKTEINKMRAKKISV